MIDDFRSGSAHGPVHEAVPVVLKNIPQSHRPEIAYLLDEGSKPSPVKPLSGILNDFSPCRNHLGREHSGMMNW